MPGEKSISRKRLNGARSPDQIPRQVLPIPDRQHVGTTTYDVKDPDTKFPPIEQLRPPKGAPNVLVILIDDCGFGASSVFGGPIPTPTAERLAKNGLRFNRFHTTALCSPTRQALLTGRNHHSVNMGGICEIATSAPGYTSVLPKNKAPLAMTLKLNGYATAQFGKCHEVPVWETSPMGPFNQWPSGGGGFEYFYGFIGGETNQWYPAIYEGTTPIEQGKSPEEGYHFTEDMTNKAMGWVRQQKALMPDKPFFMYYAPGATHAPHHVPKEWIDKYKGKFDGGWDKLRKETFARQKKLGVIPVDAVLTKRPDEIPAYDDMPAVLKPILAREMEVYAGFLEHTDHHIGRLIDTLKDLEVLDDTLIYYIFGDNGASAEGTLNGCFNEVAVLNGMGTLETPEFLMSKIDKFGGPEAYNHYAVGWAHAMNTPYQWTKQVASHWGGTRNGTIVHWPHGIEAKCEIRSQFSHVIDIAPTVLEAAGIPAPAFVNGVQQAPYEGASMLYAFNDAKAPERRETQYFEMFCNRGIYHKGWTAVTRHSIPWMATAMPVLNVGYAEAGPAEGPAVILLHGWPYDIYSYVDVAPLLASRGYRVIVPYLRGYGTTRFLSSETALNGQQAVIAVDTIALMDALRIEKAIVAGFDWGARTANIVAALWPERCKAMVSVSGYLIGNREANKRPLPPRAELAWWYQFYFATERGRAGYEANRHDFAKLIWQIASPKWNFDDATFNRSATSFDNPDHVSIVIHNYRWRIGLAEGEPKHDDLEKRLADGPVITVPTITLESDANGAPHPDASSYAKKFSGRYAHRIIEGAVGHNLPQEATQAFAEAVVEVDGY